MRRALVVGFLALILVAAGSVGLIRDGRDGAEGATGPAVDPSVLSGMNASTLQQTVAELQVRLRELPGDSRAWATLGLAYVETARVSGDPSYYPKSQDALDRSLEIEPEDNDLALAGQAALAAARHDFAGALASARDALAVNGYQLQALAIQVDALTELGRYRAQLRALQAADRRRPDSAIFTRYSYAYELRGDLDAAVRLLRRTLDAATGADQSFVLTQLADIERRTGDLQAAGRLLRRARSADPNHVPALAGLARLHVAQGDLAAAEQAWLDVTTTLPLPEYVTELAELYLATGRPDLAAEQFRVLEATTTLLADGGVEVDLELSLYEADHGSSTAALDAARSEWSRRHSVHVADALAWALHVRGRGAEALTMTREATRLGTPLAGFWIHRGLIEAERGLGRAAVRHLRRGLALDPGLSPWQVARARTALAELNGQVAP